MRKGEIALYEQFLFFPVFSSDLNDRYIKTRASFGKKVNSSLMLTTDCKLNNNFHIVRYDLYSFAFQYPLCFYLAASVILQKAKLRQLGLSLEVMNTCTPQEPLAKNLSLLQSYPPCANFIKGKYLCKINNELCPRYNMHIFGIY